MAKARIPTETDVVAVKYKEEMSSLASRREKVSWNRKMDNMIKLVAALKPIENKIVNLQAKKQPLMDQIAALRETMKQECIHPVDHLVYVPSIVDLYKETPINAVEHAICKFCNRRLVLK